MRPEQEEKRGNKVRETNEVVITRTIRVGKIQVATLGLALVWNQLWLWTFMLANSRPGR